jgi:hypothetical protein
MKGHILYMSLREILPGEELVVDYNFTYTGDKSRCACGAKTCRGIMEKLTPKLQRELEKQKTARAGKPVRAAQQAQSATA